jgi:hypothetical protein
MFTSSNKPQHPQTQVVIIEDDALVLEAKKDIYERLIPSAQIKLPSPNGLYDNTEKMLNKWELPDNGFVIISSDATLDYNEDGYDGEQGNAFRLLKDRLSRLTDEEKRRLQTDEVKIAIIIESSADINELQNLLSSHKLPELCQELGISKPFILKQSRDMMDELKNYLQRIGVITEGRLRGKERY